MALRAVTRAAKHIFVSPSDPDYKMVPGPSDPENPDAEVPNVAAHGEGATKFHLRGLDVALMAHIYDAGSVLAGKEGSDEIQIHTQVNKTNLEAVRFGLTGFENFRDNAGNDVRVRTIKRNVAGRSYEVLSDETLDAVGIDLMQELGPEVKRISRLTGTEAGNSVAA